jgi:type II secretory pathway pseudopilin PulG
MKPTKGQSLVELLIVISLSAILLPAFLTGLVASRGGKAQQLQKDQATIYLKEYEEVIRHIKDTDWDKLTPLDNSSLYPTRSGNDWILTAGAETVDDFTKKIQLSPVYRDASGAIITSTDPNQKDPLTIQVLTTVSWNQPIATNLTSTTYLTHYSGNQARSETTDTQFNNGELIDIGVTNASGGEINLALDEQANKAKWCEPSFSDQSVDLPEVPTAVMAIPGHVFVSMGKAGATASSFAHVLVNTDPTLSFTLAGSFNGGYKTLAVFGDDNYGYLALNNSGSKKVAIIDLNTYQEVGYFSVNNNSFPATSISVYNNRGYVTLGGYLYVFNLTSKIGSRPQIYQRILFSNTANINDSDYSPAKETNLRQVGAKTYVFVAVNGLYTSELVIVDVTKDTNPNRQWGKVGEVDIDSNHCSNAQRTRGVYVKPDGSRAYISDANANDYKEFFVIDTSNKTHPTVIGGVMPRSCSGTYGGWEAVGMDPQQSVVTLPLINRAIVVGTSGPEQYVVLDLGNESAPTRCGGLPYSPGIFGVASAQQDNGDVYAFLITGDATQDLKVVQGGPDVVAGKYLSTGTYTSQPMDLAGHPVVFNRFYFNRDTPAGTSIEFQIAAADPGPSGCSDATYTFVGPDQTSNTKFTASSPIPLNDDGTGYENPARCFKYKAFLSTTDTNVTPTLYDFNINYTP